MLRIICSCAAITALMALTQGCSGKDEQRIGSGVVLYEGIQPNTLFLGPKIGDTAQKCVRAVVIRDAELACTNNRCDEQVFHLPVRPLSNGQRALHVVPCNGDPDLANGTLLTDRSSDDSTAILYFQSNRSGDQLWRQIVDEGGQYKIEFPTEASVGILRLDEHGGYVWEELIE
ncbi:hypothetical protein [Limnobacter sp.]|uniref:hypothetical protein n=1 Tax=Limnobacter sp. TaxID=2003368 RepID=UPI0035178E56